MCSGEAAVPPGLLLVHGFESLSPHLQNWTDCPVSALVWRLSRITKVKHPMWSLVTWIKISRFVTLVHLCVSLRSCYNILYTVGAPYVFLGLNWIKAEDVHPEVVIILVVCSPAPPCQAGPMRPPVTWVSLRRRLAVQHMEVLRACNGPGLQEWLEVWERHWELPQEPLDLRSVSGAQHLWGPGAPAGRRVSTRSPIGSRPELTQRDKDKWLNVHIRNVATFLNF